MKAFIGLGNMGMRMSVNMNKKHKDVKCYDISMSARRRGKKLGLRVSSSAEEAVAGAEVILTMLPSGAEVEEFYLGRKGVMSLISKGSLLIDCSTCSPLEARKLSEESKKRGLSYMDAPVSGGITGAEKGTLSFLAGGEKKDMKKARELLSSMGTNIFHAGGIGMGQSAKICNNMMLSVQMVGACEALLLGEKMGLSLETLSEIMKKSSGGNWVLEKYNPMPGVMSGMPWSKGYKGGFAVNLMLKDSDLAMSSSKELKASTPLSALANQIFRMHQKAGNGDLDFGSIQKFLK